MAYFACLHKQKGEGLGWEVSAEGVSSRVLHYWVEGSG